MASTFPTTIDALTDGIAGNYLNNPDHTTVHNDANDAIEKLETKVGVDSSAVTTTHDYKLSGVTGTDKAVSKTGTETLTSKTLTTPTINSATITGTITGISSGDNLLLNPGFIDSNADNLPDFGVLTNTPTLAIAADTLFPALGGNNVTITAVGAGYEGIKIIGGTANWLKVKPSTTYTFSFDYKVTDASDRVYVQLRSYNGATEGTAHVNDSTTLTSTTAVRKSYTLTTDANANNLQIILAAAADGDIVIVSHPKLEEGSIATPFMPIQNLFPQPSGWIPATGAWTYASANTITVTSGAASIYQKGDKVMFTNTTLKYGVIIAVADTLLTIAINTDYVVANAAITDMYYSHTENPMGFPDKFNYTPTGPTNTTLTGRFSIQGRTAFCSILGAVTGTPAFTNMPTLPVAASSTMLSGANTFAVAGVGGYVDTGTATVLGGIFPVANASGTVCVLTAIAGTAVSATDPITWANTDYWWVTFRYEI